MMRIQEEEKENRQIMNEKGERAAKKRQRKNKMVKRTFKKAKGERGKEED